MSVNLDTDSLSQTNGSITHSTRSISTLIAFSFGLFSFSFGLFERRSVNSYTSLTKKALWPIAGTLYTLFVGHTLKTLLKEDVVLSKERYG